MIEKIDKSHEAVRKTGKAFLIAGSVVAIFLLLKHSHISGWSGWDWSQGWNANGWKWFFGIGAGLFALSHVAYPLMKPLHVGWMTLAFALGWLNTRLLLGIFYYLILTPIGLVMRLFGKDILNEKIDRSATTYWIKREQVPVDKARYENLF